MKNKICSADIMRLIINTTIIGIDGGPAVISPSNITSLLDTTRYQVNKYIKELKGIGMLEYKSVNFGPEDDYSPPYNGYCLSDKARLEWSVYISMREQEELELIEKCFG